MNGGYSLYIDDEFLHNHIDQGTHQVELFYENLQQIDHYDNSELDELTESSDNFYVAEMRVWNELVKA